MYGIPFVLSIMLLLNMYLAFRIYKKSTRALKACLWLYGLQILASYETDNSSYSLNLGMNISLNWSYKSLSISINILALMIFLVVFMALYSVVKANTYEP